MRTDSTVAVSGADFSRAEGPPSNRLYSLRENCKICHSESRSVFERGEEFAFLLGFLANSRSLSRKRPGFGMTKRAFFRSPFSR
jgi:hypothetical protein